MRSTAGKKAMRFLGRAALTAVVVMGMGLFFEAQASYLQRVAVAPASPKAEAHHVKNVQPNPKTKSGSAHSGSTKGSSSPSPKSHAKSKSQSKSKSQTKAKSQNHLGREFVFDGSTVSGQYHSAGEAVAKVEQEKKLNDLVGMRRDFKDRLTAEKERLQKGEEPSAE